MIQLTRLNGREFLLNCELIKFIEETPDTVVTLVNGDRLVVVENADEIVTRVVQYSRQVRIFRTD